MTFSSDSTDKQERQRVCEQRAIKCGAWASYRNKQHVSHASRHKMLQLVPCGVFLKNDILSKMSSTNVPAVMTDRLITQLILQITVFCFETCRKVLKKDARDMSLSVTFIFIRLLFSAAPQFNSSTKVGDVITVANRLTAAHSRTYDLQLGS